MRPSQAETLWRFVRGDLPADSFDDWVCAKRELEQELGPDLYLQAISGPYRKPDDEKALKDAIERHLRSRFPAQCACMEMRDLHVVMMGRHERLFATLKEVRSRGKPYWWLWAARCTACHQDWLVASEERQNDVFCMRRMSEAEAEAVLKADSWPADFDSYERLIELGIAAGIVFSYLDPLDTKPTVVDLARARPGIRVTELARLLALDADEATAVAKHAVQTEGVSITFDS